jgi:hypothetical protein
MIMIASTLSHGDSGISTAATTMVTTLNIAGDRAGMKKCRSAFSIPIAAAATAMSVSVGSITRASMMVCSSFPGTSA